MWSYKPTIWQRIRSLMFSERAFARAVKSADWEHRHLIEICENVKSRFLSVIHKVVALYESDSTFRTWVFLKEDKNVRDSISNGIRTLIEDAVYEELERFGRGKRGEILVEFEWDSDENIQKNFGGDYYGRML